MFEDHLRLCLDLASKLGAEYCDVRFIKSNIRSVSYNGAVKVNSEVNEGVGVRVIVNGSWGFSGISSIEYESCKDAVKRAVKIARAASFSNKSKVKLVDSPTVKGTYVNSVEKAPSNIEGQDAIDLLVTSVKVLKKQSGRIKFASASLKSFEEEKYLGTSEGSTIYQKLLGCGANIQGKASKNGIVQRRSYPQSLGFNLATKGYEWIEEADLVNNASRIGKELAQLLEARTCPCGFTDLILKDDLLALQIHETIGHPTELDRALDTEWDFAGSTFLTPEKLGVFRFGSTYVNVVADPTMSGGPGSYRYDDEAVEGKKIHLMKDGLFVGYQSSRETAAALNLKESSGGMRAMAAHYLPLIRMNNINLLPGDWISDEIIKDTKEGILMTAPLMEIFDQRRRTFTFSGEIAWHIRNGEIVDVLKDPVYNGKTLDFWLGCDAIAKDGWSPFSSGCGKGRPHQNVRVGHYCSLARFRKVRVGASS